MEHDLTINRPLQRLPYHLDINPLSMINLKHLPQQLRQRWPHPCQLHLFHKRLILSQLQLLEVMFTAFHLVHSLIGK